jgi:hypothetical protein
MSDLVHVQPVPGGNVPQPTFDQVTEMAAAVYKSGLFACKSPEQALTLMLLCQAENLHPINAMRQFHIIQGRPAMRADAMLARFQKAGGKVEWEHRDETRASAKFWHEQSCPTPVPVEWTMEDAKRAGLLSNDTWRKYPRQMLTARVISEGVRTVLPEVCVGLYTPEEAEDMPAQSPPPPALVSQPKRPALTHTAPKVDKVDGTSIDAASSDDPYRFDENFIAGWRLTLADRDFSEADADKVLAGMLRTKNADLGELTVPNRHALIAKAKAGDYDRHRSKPKASAPAHPPSAGLPEEIPDPCDYETIRLIAVQYRPEDIETPDALEQFERWMKLGSSKPWEKLSKDERSRVFKGIKAGEPWQSVTA